MLLLLLLVLLLLVPIYELLLVLLFLLLLFLPLWQLVPHGVSPVYQVSDGLLTNLAQGLTSAARIRSASAARSFLTSSTRAWASLSYASCLEICSGARRSRPSPYRAR